MQYKYSRTQAVLLQLRKQLLAWIAFNLLQGLIQPVESIREVNCEKRSWDQSTYGNFD